MQSQQAKARLLQTLRTICSNLRGLQISGETISAYREVEELLGDEIARIRPAPATGARRPAGRPPSGAGNGRE